MYRFLLSLFCSLLTLGACNSSTVKDAVDLADGVPKKDIDKSKLGMNAFVNDNRFGSARAQLKEVRDTLGITRLRMLVAWNSGVHPNPNTPPDFSFYDDIIGALPASTEALLVLTGVPDWMRDPSNWTEGNPRSTFVDRWVRPVARRYGSNPQIVGFQIWNEPNAAVNPDNTLLGLVTAPSNYVEMLARASSIIRDIAPGKLVVTAATTSINQNFPASLDYNRGMRDAGASEFADVWAIHYYGKQFERVLQNGGVADFVNGLDPRIWVTESNAQGVNEQLGYGEQVWPFLIDEMPAIERIYVYQFTDATGPDQTYGLRNLSGEFPVSDLYIWLRDGK